MQPGDVKETYAEITDIQKDVGFYPTTTLEIGLGHFVDWYKSYYLS
jgi:UDP-glucuronate 4-epimerase